jgi:excisionase family DNA binding protein
VPDAPLLTAREAAELLRVSVRTLYALDAPRVRLGRRVVFDRDELLAWARRRSTHAQARERAGLSPLALHPAPHRKAG